MTPERWQRIKKILDRAAAAPAGKRRSTLRQECGEDAHLLFEVQALFELDDEVDDFIEEPLWSLHRQTENLSSEAEEPIPGRRVGPYKIQRLLGRGGMGSVYLAARQDDFQQQVALKVLSWGADSKELLARFYNERQILANLRHPHIARLLDGGTTDEGLPYFAMEYVEGEPIDLYCETHRLSIARRLQLFRRVCAAVHFAHQNLIVHRDLKPGNILITADGTPQLLDFGIAKLLEPGLASRTLATSTGRAPMTPAYASPEQILGEQVTTACDVYSLGVLLYRLLIGSPPYELDGTSYAEMVQIICLREPRRPSTAVRQQESALATEPPTVLDVANPTESISPHPAADGNWQRQARRLRRRIAGDLDAIVLKAMRKEPRHRYASAAELAEDIRRHQVGLPVSARKGTVAYNLGKFLRRNKPALAAALAVIAFSVTTTVLWRQAVEDRAQAVSAQARAERERARAQRVSVFLEELFESADPDASQGKSVTVLEALELGRQRISVELEGEPEIRAEILGTLGTVHNRLGLYAQARELKEEALRVRRAANPEDRPDLAKDINNLASFLYSTGDFAGAENYFREALEMRRRLDQDDSKIAITMHNLASTLNQRGNYREAEDLHRRVLEIRRQIYGPEDRRVATSLYSLGSLYSELGAFTSAEPLLRQAIDIRSRALGPQHTQVAAICNSLGRMLQAKGDYKEARRLYERALTIRRERLGDEHVMVANSKKNLASLLLESEETDAAGELLSEALATLRKSRPEGDWSIADSESIWGAYLMASGRFQEAEHYLIKSYVTIQKIEGDHTISTRAALKRIIELYDARDQPEKAAEYRAIADATSHSDLPIRAAF